MAKLQPWISNPPSTFTGATTFTPAGAPLVGGRDPMKLKPAASGRYATSFPTVSAHPLALKPWRETPGTPKSHPQRGKRVGAQPAFLDHQDMVKRTIVP